MHVRLVALVPVLGLVLSGCSQDTTPPPSAVPTAASPTASPSPAVVQVPASARAATTQGAAAFARYYLEVLSDANETGEVAELRALSMPECNVCLQLQQQIDEAATKQQHLVGARYQVEFAEATASKPGDAVVDVTYSQPAGALVDARGDQVLRLPARPRALVQLRLIRSDDVWRTFGMRFSEVVR